MWFLANRCYSETCWGNQVFIKLNNTVYLKMSCDHNVLTTFLLRFINWLWKQFRRRNCKRFWAIEASQGNIFERLCSFICLSWNMCLEKNQTNICPENYRTPTPGSRAWRFKVKSITLELDCLGSNPASAAKLAVSSWTSYSTCCFLICKMGIVPRT